jgi:predicted 3-demethylubiquinone-9 3-methyltransferase (glyoxalase superfamily)
VFSKSKIGPATRYTKNQKPDKEGNLAWGSFVLEGQSFAAMDSARIHDFTFNEAVSLEVRCKDQKEIDYFWKKLSAEPKSEQCGWLKDKYGLSWQITPTGMSAMLQTKDKARAKRVTQAFLKMKKIDIAVLEKEYQGS